MGKVKKLDVTGYINLSPILSYTSAIFYFIDTVRNIGKTWSISNLAWRRAYKRGKKTIFVRRFQKEARELAASMYESEDIKAYCKGLVPYDPATKKGNFKKRGRTFYIKRNKKWEWFLKIAWVTDAQTFRSADDVKCDLILYDEYTTTPEKERYVRGNECELFIDLVVSISRMHALRCIFCGNKEAVINPYYNYLGILPPKSDFEGIRSYKKDSIVIYQRNTPVCNPKNKEFQAKLQRALEGTSYGAYLYKGAYKREPKFKWSSPPVGAKGYAQLCLKGEHIRVTAYKNYFYIDNKIDEQLGVITDDLSNANSTGMRLNKRVHRPLFKELEIAIVENRVRYSCNRVYEGAQQAFACLGIL